MRNEERGTRNEERETRNEERETRNEKRGTRNEKRETRNYGKNPQNADFGFIIFFAGRRGRRPLHTRRKFCKTTVYRTESLMERRDGKTL